MTPLVYKRETSRCSHGGAPFFALGRPDWRWCAWRFQSHASNHASLLLRRLHASATCLSTVRPLDARPRPQIDSVAHLSRPEKTSILLFDVSNIKLFLHLHSLAAGIEPLLARSGSRVTLGWGVWLEPWCGCVCAGWNDVSVFACIVVRGQRWIVVLLLRWRQQQAQGTRHTTPRRLSERPASRSNPHVCALRSPDLLACHVGMSSSSCRDGECCPSLNGNLKVDVLRCQQAARRDCRETSQLSALWSVSLWSDCAPNQHVRMYVCAMLESMGCDAFAWRCRRCHSVSQHVCYVSLSERERTATGMLEASA